MISGSVVSILLARGSHCLVDDGRKIRRAVELHRIDTVPVGVEDSVYSYYSWICQGCLKRGKVSEIL